jgi:transposase
MIKSRGDFHFLTLSEADQFMYPSDLTDAEWKRIAHHFRPKDRRGSGCKHEKKRIVDAILYVVKGGIQWRMLPKDFPPWKTVYDHFSKWNKRGVWEAALDALNRLHRKKSQGRHAELWDHRLAKHQDPVCQ